MKKRQLWLYPSVVSFLVFGIFPWGGVRTFTEKVRMRDGIHLATEVYLPARAGKYPTILIRTPYNRKNFDQEAKKAVKEGFAVVVQDVRGRFDSEGLALAFYNDTEDGYDTVEWIIRQKWSNGKVATYGGSAMGIAQNMLAMKPHPALTAQFVIVAAASLYHDAAYQGGILRKEQVEGWLTKNKFPEENFSLYRQHPLYDDFWKKVNLLENCEDIAFPVLYLGGWFDTFLEGTISAFQCVQTKAQEEARKAVRLVIGPWTHGGIGKTLQGEFTFPRTSTYPGSIADPLPWFLQHFSPVKEIRKSEFPVTYYLMGDLADEEAPGNAWKTADRWPPEGYENVPLYLHPDGSLQFFPPQSEKGAKEFFYDPQNPVPTLGGRNLTIDAGPYDQRPIENRPDVLLFTSPPLEKPLEVVGKIQLILYASSTASDPYFAAKITDVYPQEQSVLITDGILRGRLREGFHQDAGWKPGRVYKILMDLGNTAIVFNKGHRIRLSISASNFPRWEKPSEPARYSIFSSRNSPSYLLLPIKKSF
ncbi:MAG: CocE/NonD family hydrolase [bacterium JZ-2024 1]